ncbi:hypothetical protein [Rhodospirillum sp. A1_3_36]|uniref:tetratricopeptide repeat protein n=1 Tax=Rhodospirillum sp. A1_3_36 TaxID=3391666 RepID=UPI0039A422C0
MAPSAPPFDKDETFLETPSFDAAYDAHLAGHLERAEAGYRALLGRPEEVLGTRTLLAAIRRARGDKGEADVLERSELAPLTAGALSRLGSALLAMDDPVAARALARTLVDRQAEDPDSGSNSGIEGLVLMARASQALGDREGAERVLRAAIEQNPDHGEAVCLLSRLLRVKKRTDLALDLLKQTLERCPGDAALLREQAHVRLSRGDWVHGWRDLALAEERKAAAGERGAVGGASLEPWIDPPAPGTRILVRAFGPVEETLLLLRFAIRLAKGGVEVALEVPETLLPLLDLVHCFSRVGLRDSLGLDHDLILDLAILPGLMGGDPAGPEPDGAYLEVPLERVLGWGNRLEPGLNLGLDWSRASREIGLAGGIPLEDLAPLLILPGVNWIALAWWDEAARGAADPWRARIVFPFAEGGGGDGGGQPVSGTILDTAALLFSMDLVVTTDSVVAHLAGALGRPCWVLLPADAGWCWGTEGETTPWYPTLRLFRQQWSDDWRGPVWTIAAEVGRQLAATSRD